MKNSGGASKYPQYLEQLRTGNLLDESDFLARSGLDREGLSRALLAGKLFYVTDGHSRAYPKFFVDEGVAPSLIEDLSVVMAHLSGNVKWLFWTQPRGSLTTHAGVPRTPLEALADGDVELVRRCAEARAHE